MSLLIEGHVRNLQRQSQSLGEAGKGEQNNISKMNLGQIKMKRLRIL